MSINSKLKQLKQIGIGLIAITVVGGCTLQNPFNPLAELKVLSIKPNREITKSVGGFSFKFNSVGIFQSFASPTGLQNQIVTYDFVEPMVTFKNKEGLPKVTFTKGFVEYDFDDITLPPRDFPITATVDGSSSAGQELQISVIEHDESLRSFVFPGNTPTPRAESARAKLTLEGRDFNNNPVSVKFTVPVRFETTGLLAPSTSPTPIPKAGG